MSRVLRWGSAGGAGLALVGLGAWSMGAGRIEGPGRVEAPAEFRISDATEGYIRWSLLDGTAPGGPVVVSDGLLQVDRGDPLAVERLPELSIGARVEAGQGVARLRAPSLGEEVDALVAEALALAAEEALLVAGGRPEAIARAQQGVDLAVAGEAQARAQVEHLEGLVAQGAGGTWAVEEARQALAVQEAQVALARAALAEARLPPRAEELDEVRARRTAVDARLKAARERQDGQLLTSPIAGILGPPGEERLLSVTGDGPPMLHLAVDEQARGRVHVGDAVRFTPTAAFDGPVGGRVLAVGASTVAVAGRPVAWVVAALDAPVPVGATGTGRVLDGKAP